MEAQVERTEYIGTNYFTGLFPHSLGIEFLSARLLI
jgi:hypothetical protein